MLQASVVIPAHNEQGVIARCLTALLDDTQGFALEVIVVCNGCSDNTAAIARGFAGVRVIELDTASKIAALNAGDQARSFAPVAYVDADVVLSGQSLLKCLQHLTQGDVQAVSPQLEVDLRDSSLLVKAFYGIWLKLPYFQRKGAIGSGVYILSQEGRARFAQFPDVIADDGYVRALFAPTECCTVPDASFRIFAPRDVKTLINIKTRVRLGNQQIRQRFPAMPVGRENSSNAFLALVLKKPWLLPAAVVYAYVQWRTAQGAKQRLAEQKFSEWERDESSRIARDA